VGASKSGNSITLDKIDAAVKMLYGGWDEIPDTSKTMINAAFEYGDYEKLYLKNRENEVQSKGLLLDFNKDYPGAVNGENIDKILDKARRKRKQNSIDEILSDEEVEKISKDLIDKNQEACSKLADNSENN
jgi:hypothetical protein